MSRLRSHHLGHGLAKTGLPTPAIIGLIALLSVILLCYCGYKCCCREERSTDEAIAFTSPSQNSGDQSTMAVVPAENPTQANLAIYPIDLNTNPTEGVNSLYPTINTRYNSSVFANDPGANPNLNGVSPNYSLVGPTQCNIDMNPTYSAVVSTPGVNPMHSEEHNTGINTYTANVVPTNTDVNPAIAEIAPGQNGLGLNQNYPTSAQATQDINPDANSGIIPSHPAVHSIQTNPGVCPTYPAVS